MSNKAKRKGKYLEDKVSKIIQESLQLQKHEVHRNLTSGVFTWEFGDIYFKNYRFIIEVKNRKDFELQHLFPEVKKPVLDWYKQLKKDADKFKKQFKMDCLYCLCIGDTSRRLPIFSIMHQSDLKEFLDNKFLSDINFNFFALCKNGFIITTLECFLQKVIKENIYMGR